MDKIIVKGYGKELGLFQLIIIVMFLAILPILSFQHRGFDKTSIVTFIICISIVLLLFLAYKNDSRQLEFDKTSITYVTSSILHKQKPKWTFSAKRPNKVIIKKDRILITRTDYTDGISITLIDHNGKMTTKMTATPLTAKVIDNITQWSKTNDLNIIIDT